MSKVITFSTRFPKGHIKEGKPTYFLEKLLLSFYGKPYSQGFLPKNHTIRSGNRWKVGDKFSPRIWSGKPYNSKQIIISTDIEIKKVWDFEIEPIRMKNMNAGDLYVFLKINGHNVWCTGGIPDNGLLDKLALNDGLTTSDFKSWFKWGEPFKGQIICWNENINY